MQKYVEGLQEIIETMSFTENVQNFVGSLQGLENINLDELEIIAPGMKKLAESHPSSPFNSRTNSPQHGASSNIIVDEEVIGFIAFCFVYIMQVFYSHLQMDTTLQRKMLNWKIQQQFYPMKHKQMSQKRTIYIHKPMEMLISPTMKNMWIRLIYNTN